MVFEISKDVKIIEDVRIVNNEDFRDISEDVGRII